MGLSFPPPQQARQSLGGLQGVISGTWDMGSGTTAFVDFGGTNVTRKTYTKLEASTLLVVRFSVSVYLTGTSSPNAVVELGVQVDSTDYGGRRLHLSEISEVVPFSELIAVSGIAAGARGVELRSRWISGTGTLRGSDSVPWTVDVEEVPGTLSYS